MSAAAFGIDVGGQSAKGVLVDANGGVLASGSFATGEAMTPEALAVAIAKLLGELQAAAGGRGDALPLGIGVAGVLDRGGELRGSPHLPGLLDCRLAAFLAESLRTTVVVHNDADCAAIAEGWKGAADGEDDFLLITVGTGIGSGLVLGGRLRTGGSGHGCELGHMTLVAQGRHCGCGNLGCLEAYISETAATRLVEEAGGALREAVASRRARRGGGNAQAVFELADAGDDDAERIAVGMVTMLGFAIGSVVNVLDLETIVLGGGIAPAVLARLPRLRAAAGTTLFARPASALRLVAASRGPMAGAIGAARLGILAADRPHDN